MRAQPLIPRCGRTATSGAGGSCAARCSRQCNQAKCAITHRVDLTSGHLVKLKTRHLRRTRSLPSITPVAPDWPRGELRPYKCSGEPLWEAPTPHSASYIHSHHPTPPVFSSQKVSNCREERHRLSFLPPPTADGDALSSGILSNTCQHETGHLVPLPGEHSIRRACKYRGTRKGDVSSAFLNLRARLAEATTSLCAFHIAVLLPLPAPPGRHQATGGAVTGEYACCNSLKRS